MATPFFMVCPMPALLDSNRIVLLRWFAVLTLSVAGARASEPAPEQLVPGDTVALITVPDRDQLAQTAAATPLGQLWRDPLMKAFKEKLQGRWQTNVVMPLERELGIKFSDYLDLIHGQVSLAFTRFGRDGTTNPSARWVLIADIKDNPEALQLQIASLRKKWVDAGKTLKTEKLRGIEFTSLVFAGYEVSRVLESAFPLLSKEKGESEPNPAQTNRTEITVGQAGTLCIVGNSISDIEKVLARRSGGMVPSLAEQAGFEAQRSVVRESVGWIWIDLQTLIATLRKGQIASQQNQRARNPLAPAPEKIFSGLGLDGLKSLAVSIKKESPEGNQIEMSLRVAEADRKGIFKMLAFEPKESQPPPFVSNEAVKFNRLRLDGVKAWAQLETTLAEISPDLSGLLQATLQAIGKDKDENLDIKKALIGNLGNDLVYYQKKPVAATAAALKSPPSITLIGSPNPNAMIQALKAALDLLPTPGGEFKETEFLGRKIYTLVFPESTGQTGQKSPRLHFAPSSGYLAFSSTQSMIEEFLRSTENKPRGLAEIPGFADAVQKVGGNNSGLLGYENQLESTRVLWEAVIKDPAAFDARFSTDSMTARIDVQDAAGDLGDWFDFALLPPYDQVSKYFHFTVYAGSIAPDGLNIKFFAPTPPQLKK